MFFAITTKYYQSAKKALSKEDWALKLVIILWNAGGTELFSERLH